MLFRSGHLYLVMAAEPGAEAVTNDLDLLIGPRLLERNEPQLLLFLDNLIEQNRRILKGLARSPRQDMRKKETKIKVQLKELEGVLEKCRQKQK